MQLSHQLLVERTARADLPAHGGAGPTGQARGRDREAARELGHHSQASPGHPARRRVLASASKGMIVSSQGDPVSFPVLRTSFRVPTEAELT